MVSDHENFNKQFLKVLRILKNSNGYIQIILNSLTYSKIGKHEPIECVEMHTRCFIRLEQFSNEIDSLMYTVVTDGFVVIFNRCQNICDLLRHFQFGNFDDLT